MSLADLSVPVKVRISRWVMPFAWCAYRLRVPPTIVRRVVMLGIHVKL